MLCDDGSGGKLRIGEARWIWPSSCGGVEWGNISWRLLWAGVKSVLPCPSFESVLCTFVSLVFKERGHAWSVVMMLTGGGAAVVLVVKCHWTWFSAWETVERGFCLFLSIGSFVLGVWSYGPWDVLARKPLFHENRLERAAFLMVVLPTRAYVGSRFSSVGGYVKFLY